MPVRFLLVRHGERIDKVDREWAKTAEHPSDPFLTKTGFAQARALGLHLAANYHVTKIYASPFTRTLQTATQIADVLDLPLHPEPGVCEWLNGDWFPAYHWPTLRDATTAFPRLVGAPAPPVAGVPQRPETRAGTMARVATVATALAAQHEAEAAASDDPGREETILIVTHGIICEAFAAALARPESFPWVTYCCLTEIVQSGETPTGYTLGKAVCETSFLPEEMRPTKTKPSVAEFYK